MLSTTSTCSLQSETVARAVLSLRLGSSSLSRLLQGILSGASVQASFLLALRELWSLLCDDSFCSRSPSAHQFLIPLFTSAPCGDNVKPGSWRFRQSTRPLRTSSSPSPPPCSPPSQEKLNSVCLSWACFTSCSGQGSGGKSCGTTFRSSTSGKLPGTATFFWCSGRARSENETPTSSRKKSRTTAPSMFSSSRSSPRVQYHRPSATVATYQHFAGADGGPQRKLWKSTSGKGCTTWKASPFRLTSDTVGKRVEKVVEVRVRAVTENSAQEGRLNCTLNRSQNTLTSFSEWLARKQKVRTVAVCVLAVQLLSLFTLLTADRVLSRAPLHWLYDYLYVFNDDIIIPGNSASRFVALLPARPLRGGSCLSRRRAQCAGGETELYLESVSEHVDLIS